MPFIAIKGKQQSKTRWSFDDELSIAKDSAKSEFFEKNVVCNLDL